MHVLHNNNKDVGVMPDINKTSSSDIKKDFIPMSLVVPTSIQNKSRIEC